MSLHTGNSEDRKTPLYAIHKALKAKMVSFGGWLMPVSYTSVLAEHKTVREQCGIFDVSHMGEILVRGSGAEALLQRLTINNVASLADGHGQYSAFLNEQGGMIDDLILYRLKQDEYLVCVNASNTEKDFAWVKQHADKAPNVVAENQSGQWSQLAIQGPTSKAAVQALLTSDDKRTLDTLAYTQIMPVKLHGQLAYAARTGYTGEWGYELYLPPNVAAATWNALMATQPATGLQPIGLGARDTLRLEACYLLYGNDMDESVSPLEAGIAWAVRMDCGDFIGKEALLRQKEGGLTRGIFAFHMEGDGIPRHDMPVFKGDKNIGKVTSGSVLPTVGGAGGMALLDLKSMAIGEVIEIDIRGKRKPARVVKKPLYKAKVKG